MGNSIDYVMDNVYIGGEVAATDKQLLNEKKITRIINCAKEIDCKFQNQGIKYLKFDLNDYELQKIDDCFDKAHEFILQTPKNENILVHCMAGVSRSATIVLSYLIKCHKMNLNDAHKLLKEKRPQINPNSGFIRQLRVYERHLTEKGHFSLKENKLNNSVSASELSKSQSQLSLQSEGDNGKEEKDITLDDNLHNISPLDMLKPTPLVLNDSVSHKSNSNNNRSHDENEPCCYIA